MKDSFDRGAWRVEGQLSRLGGAGGPEHSTWRYDAYWCHRRGRPHAENSRSTRCSSAGSCPAGARWVAAAWKTWNAKSADETVVAMYCANARVLLLRSMREASSRRALALADWHAETLNAPVTEREIVRFVCQFSNQQKPGASGSGTHLGAPIS